MIIKDLIRRLKENNIEVSLSGDDLEVNFSDPELPDTLYEAIKANKPEIVAFLKRINQDGNDKIPVAPEQPAYVLSSSQRLLWILSQNREGNIAYNMPGVFLFEGEINERAIERSFETLVRRHESLRTVFNTDNEGNIVQRVQTPETTGFKLNYLDLTSQDRSEDQITRIINEEIIIPFDLTKGPLFRACLYRLKCDRWMLAYTIHHIISDGWSMGILNRELFALYDAFRNRERAKLPPLGIQYRDFASWQQKQLAGETMNEHRAYWLDQFSGELPVLELPVDKSRPALKTYNGDTVEKKLDKKAISSLKNLCHGQSCTVFMGLLAALNSLFYHYSAQEDIVIGSPASGREHIDLENQIGLFINILPLRARFQGKDSFLNLLAHIKEMTLDAYKHQIYPFGELLDAIKGQRDMSRSPLFDVMIILQNANIVSHVDSKYPDGLIVNKHGSGEPVHSRYDLVFNFVESGDDLLLGLNYNTDLYKRETAERLVNHLEQLIHAIIYNPDEQIEKLDYLSSKEKQTLLKTFNNTSISLPANKTIIDLFLGRVIKSPDDIAVVFEDVSLSYRQLNEQSNVLADYLRNQYTIARDDLIGIKLERSEKVLIAILAVLKTGGAYLPIDPQYPEDRVDYILTDSGCKAVIDEQELQRFWQSAGKYSSENLAIISKPEDLAYVIYTSGSTGKPKGVMVNHENVVNFFAGMTEVFGQDPGVILSFTNYTFDISVLELIWTLTLGFKVVIQRDPRHIANLPQTQKKPLDFSLFYFGNSNVEVEREKYRLLIEGAKYADRNGYSAIWTPERHFHEFGGLYPNPSVLAAAISSITKNINIRAGSVVLPLHNPLRVAEEWSVVDNLSGGRVGIACASGWHPDDFVLSPENFKERHQVMYRMIDQLQALWAGKAIGFEAGNGNLVDTKIFPSPIQKELPLWITSSGNIDTFISAGERGYNLLTHLLGDTLEGLGIKIEAYRKAFRENGHTERKGAGKVVLMLHTYIGDDLDKTYQTAHDPFIDYLSSSAGLIRNLASNSGIDIDSKDFTKDDLKQLLHQSYSRFITSASLIGTEETCLEMLDKVSKTGVDEIACLIDFGIDYEYVMSGLEFLTKIKNTYAESIAVNSETSTYSIESQLEKYQVTHLQATPSMATLLNSEAIAPMTTVRKLLLGGEKLALSLVREIYKKRPDIEIFNMYGPTETTIWSTCSKIEPDAKKILIGKPIANTQIYILNNALDPVPTGVEGEIYIGGNGVARGYVNRAELTRQVFIDNPFLSGQRMYKTGDFGRWMPDGNIEFVRRKDEQVKVHGHRIELGEIEYCLVKNNMVKQAAVILNRPEGSSELQLIAYVVGEQKLNTKELKSALKNQLPSYMLPSHIVQVEFLPLTPNGKLNRKALPDPTTLADSLENEYVAPRNETEFQLIKIWSELLKREKIGITDNFFDLGGNSLLAIQLVTKIRKSFEIDLNMNAFFNNPTVEMCSREFQNIDLINSPNLTLEDINVEKFLI